MKTFGNRRLERWLNQSIEAVDDYRVGFSSYIPLRLYVRSLWEAKPMFDVAVSCFDFLFHPKKVQTLLVSLTLLQKPTTKARAAGSFNSQQWSSNLLKHYQQALIFPTNIQGAAGGANMLLGKQLSAFSIPQQMLAAQQKFSELEQSIINEEMNRLTYGEANSREEN